MTISHVRPGATTGDVTAARPVRLAPKLGKEVSAVAVTQYKLNQAAIPGTVTVQYNGAPTQQGVDWDYDEANQQIVLKGNLPASGAVIMVCYQRRP